MVEPAIRASVLKDILASIRDELPDAVANLPPDAVRITQGASRLDWIPLDTYLQLNSAVVSAVGTEEWRAHQRHQLARLVEQPLFSSLISGARSVFGLTPSAVLRIYPHGYKLTFRGCGECTVTVDPSATSATVLYTGFPRGKLDEGYIAGSLGAVEGMVALCKAQGQASVAHSDPAEGTLQLKVTWS